MYIQYQQLKKKGFLTGSKSKAFVGGGYIVSVVSKHLFSNRSSPNVRFEGYDFEFKNLKNKSFVENFKFASNFIEKHANIEPTKWEKRLQLFSFCCIFSLFLYRTLAEIYLISNGELESFKLTSTFLQLRSLAYIILFFSIIPYVYRTFFSAVKAFFLYFKLIFKNTDFQLVSFSSIFLAGLGGTFWKMKKPIAAVCALCGSGLIGINEQYYTTYGFSPSREFELARHGYQTWDDAKRHILNPGEYMQSTYDPYIQDSIKKATELEEENAKQKNEIERLNKIVDDALRKK
jgi:hypothetical protein